MFYSLRTGDGSIDMTRKVQLGLGFALGVIALWLSLRGIRLTDAVKTALQADYLFIALALGTVMVTTLGKAARWRLLLHEHRPGLALGRLFSPLLIGQLVNAALPGRLGEIARACLIGEREDVSRVTALATIVVEKFLDSTMLLLLLAGLALAVPLPPWLRDSIPLLSLGLVGLFALLLLVPSPALSRSPERSEGTVEGKACPEPHPELDEGPSRRVEGLAAPEKAKPRQWLDRMVGLLPERWRVSLAQGLVRATDGLSLLRQPAVLCSALVSSVLIWTVAAFTNYLVIRALGIDLPQRTLVVASALVLAAVHAGVVLSPTPGQVGVFHYLCILSLSLFGIDQSLALSYGLLLHLIVYVPIALLGSLSLWKESYDWQRLRGQATKSGRGEVEECAFRS